MFSENMTCLTSVHDIFVIQYIPLTYDIGFIVHIISLASLGPIDTQKLLNPFAIAVLSVTVMLSILNV